jgi:hypothetical protein
MQIGGEMGAGDVDGGAAAAQWDAQQWQACVMVPAVDGQQAVDINNELIEAKKGQLRAVAEEATPPHAPHALPHPRASEPTHPTRSRPHERAPSRQWALTMAPPHYRPSRPRPLTAASPLPPQVHALHELMNDLGQIVAIQGGQVSHAASLAHKVHDDVAAAREELEQADRDQQKGGCVVS